MAVLYALLRHNSAVRDKPELQPVIDKHDAVLRDKDVLPVAFHLLGAESMEEALFTGYVRQVSARHPGAPLPALYHGRRAARRRGPACGRTSETRFSSPGSMAGKLLPPTAGRGFSGATSRGRRNPTIRLRRRRRDRTCGRSWSQCWSSATSPPIHGRRSFVDLDPGLAVIAEHAKCLGYDAVVLFLDELVLWLAFSVQDAEFFRRESQKITKLVESGTGPARDPADLVRRTADGPAPLVRRRRGDRRGAGRPGPRVPAPGGPVPRDRAW